MNITFDDVSHLIGHVDQMVIALRNVNDDDDERGKWIFCKELSTEKISVYKYINDDRKILIYSPNIDQLRNAVEELSYRTHQLSIDIPVTDSQLDELYFTYGIKHFRLVFSYEDKPSNFYLLHAASTKTLRVYVKSNFSMAKIFLPYHSKTEAERLIRRFLERIEIFRIYFRADPTTKAFINELLENKKNN